MTIEEAFFVLKHGSAEGIHKYLEAICAIEKEHKELKEILAKIIQSVDGISAELDSCVECSKVGNCTKCTGYHWKYADKIKEVINYEKMDIA